MRLWREHGSRRFPPRTSAPCFVTAWVYLPEGSGPHPAVVMAHGIGGIKAGGLPRSPNASARRGVQLPSR
jgi:dienelactone hydrolase